MYFLTFIIIVGLHVTSFFKHYFPFGSPSCYNSTYYPVFKSLETEVLNFSTVLTKVRGQSQIHFIDLPEEKFVMNKCKLLQRHKNLKLTH